MSAEEPPDPPPPGDAPALTPTEARLLAVLRGQPGRAFTRAELVALVIPDAVVLERTIDAHVKGLRKKLDPAAGRVETVRGTGYRFAPPEAPADDSAR
jgi:two-component system, OmpR family, phosphate regulon response regulator PhoB